MVWPLTIARSVSVSKAIHAPVETVIALLHDTDVLFSLNPLILSVNVDPSNPSVYSVTDRLVLLGCFNTQTKYQCTLTKCKDGLDSNVTANLGTRLKSHYRVQPGENGTTEVTEQTTIEGYLFSMPYIIRTMTAAHHTTLNNLAARAENPSSRQSSVSTVKPAVLEYHAVSFSTLSSIVSVVVTVFTIHLLFPGSSHIPISIIIVGALSTLFWSRMANDPYSLFHLTLNKLPGENPTAPPTTEWLNMGLWKNTDLFPQACESLAIKLIRAAKCRENGSVLDVGHGTGESLILLLSNPSIPRPSSVTGITSLQVHHNRSQQRVEQLLSSMKGSKPNVELFAEDAIYHQATHHPLNPSSKQAFDTILALDCAYHFHTRVTFLRQSFQKLLPGGRIALADICFDPKLLESPRIWLITSILGLMPKQNMVSKEGYITQMKEIGYTDVQLEDVTDDVFPGFINFLKSRGLGWKVFGLVIEWYAKTGARFVIVSGLRS
ncbi:Erythromycin 3''-O-methyltransferase [Hypsizygus marmoreus]|uniref:Erythromycin 3''-O-methyltransferase n=1 Tax=Hypsizygus marmoreus TaxID=39966 RepID=A0A369KC38_HYPMA|nr:Erythromycin 3''-O-methyltransferase [Hypsizygus marmoreus]